MDNIFSRTELLVGSDNLQRLKAAHVAVFGIGGVGGHVAEALVRSGVGTITLVDSDAVSPTNLNRQIFATQKTIGIPKVDAAEERLKEINPKLTVIKRQTFFLPENADEFDFSQYDYVVDAVDTVAAKLALVEKANESGAPIISSMGAGNKLDASAFKVADIYKTSVCPLAKVMRRELKKRGIKKLKCVYSEEQAIKPYESDEYTNKRQVPGSTAFVPAAAGLIIAGEVFKDLIKI